MERRVFLEKSGKFSLLIMIFSLISPGLLKGFLNLEKLKYPELKDVPEFLRGYASSFTSWLEVYNSQKLDLERFTNSNKFRREACSHLQDFFKNRKGEDEIKNILEKFILAMMKKINNTEIEYRPLKKYFAFLTTPGKLITADTLKMDLREDKDKLLMEKVDMFIFFHELAHRINSQGLMLRGSFDLIMDLLDKNNLMKQKNASYYIDYEGMSEENGTVQLLQKEDFNYYLRPNEILSFFSEIRTSLHNVSRYNPKLVAFNMYEDDFNSKHLDFLIKNETKIFPIFYVNDSNDVPYPQTILSVFLNNFKNEDFILLMNKGI